MIAQVYPGKVPRTIQALAPLTPDDQAYLVLAPDFTMTRFITAGTVTGRRAPPLKGLPKELDFASRVIIADQVSFMQPVQVTPDQVNVEPRRYAFQRVVMDTTYVFASARVKDAPAAFSRIGFGLATDHLGSKARQDYLTVVDPYNTETQVRVPRLTGTVLYQTQGMRLLLQQAYRFLPSDLADALDKPSLFYEEMQDDSPQPVNIGQLMPTLQDPSLKLQRYHGKIVEVQGIAFGGMVRTEDIPQLRNLPVHLTVKAIGVADLTGAMPVIGISSDDGRSGEVFGNFKFQLSVYSFGGDKAYAFLLSKTPVALDPIGDVQRARFGNRVVSSLSGYVVLKMDRTQVSADLTLENVDLLLPADRRNPVIMTRQPSLVSGDYLAQVSCDGYLLDGRILGLSSLAQSGYGAGVLVVSLCHSKWHEAPEHDMAVATKGHRRLGKSDGYCLSCHPPKASVAQGPDYGACTGCHDYSHLYVFLRDELLAYWVEQDAAEAHGEHRRITYPLRSGDETRIGRFEKVRAVHRQEKTWSGSQWRLVTCLYDHHSNQLVGRVQILTTPLVYDVFVESTVAVIVPKKGGQLHQATKVGRKLTVEESRRVTKAADTFVKAYWAKVPSKRK